MMTTANVPHDDELDVPHFEIPVFDHVEFANTKFDMSTRFNENNLKKIKLALFLISRTW